MATKICRVLCLTILLTLADFNEASRIKRIEERLNRLEDHVYSESKFRREDMRNLFDKIEGMTAVLNMSVKDTHCQGQQEAGEEKSLQSSSLHELLKLCSDWRRDHMQLAEAFKDEQNLNAKLRHDFTQVVERMQTTEDHLYAAVTELKTMLKNNKSYEMTELRMQTAEDHLYDVATDLKSMLNETNANQIKQMEHVHEITELKDELLQITEINNKSFELAELKNQLTECTETCNAKTETSTLKNERFESCVDLYEMGYRESGQYDVYPDGRSDPIRVFCDQDIASGGGWTVFQRRKDGSENFFRGWLDYKLGFGDLDGEFWLGNKYLSILTSKCCSQLRIDMENSKGVTKYAMYNVFQIKPANDKYSLKVGSFSGNVYDAMANHNGSAFITKDVDGGSCALNYGKSGWWFNFCYHSNLNGQYIDRKIHWYEFHDHQLIFTEMKFRRHVN